MSTAETKGVISMAKRSKKCKEVILGPANLKTCKDCPFFVFVDNKGRCQCPELIDETGNCNVKNCPKNKKK